MDLFKAKLITYIIAFGLIISACIGGCLYYLQPAFDWSWFIGIMFFFLIAESIIVSVIQKNSQKKEKKQLVNLYMLSKVIKVIGSLIIISVYVLVVKENVKSFVGVFISFYLLYLAAETILFIKVENNIKEKKIVMNSQLKYILLFFCLFAIGGQSSFAASGHGSDNEELNVKELILDHLSDAYEWHVCTVGDKHVSIPLPVIVFGGSSGLSIFSSSNFHHGASEHNGFYIASEGDNKGKIVEKNAAGEEIRPWDISITKNTFSLMLASLILVLVVLSVAKWYKKHSTPDNPKVPGGFIGFMELFIMNVNDDIIKPCVGKNYKKFAPYLLTAFFFIFINNLMGLIPLFPGGANVTGNIAITLVLALFTMVIVNVFGTKEYYREIFWPDVPTWLKFPLFPIMQVIELAGVISKPFALMIRLFANILAGHSIVLGLVCLIFVTVKLGTGVNASMTIVSVVLTIFIDIVEILVAYIQAYVFTMLSAVFIGLAQAEPHHHAEKH